MDANLVLFACSITLYIDHCYDALIGIPWQTYLILKISLSFYSLFLKSVYPVYTSIVDPNLLYHHILYYILYYHILYYQLLTVTDNRWWRLYEVFRVPGSRFEHTVGLKISFKIPKIVQGLRNILSTVFTNPAGCHQRPYIHSFDLHSVRHFMIFCNTRDSVTVFLFVWKLIQILQITDGVTANEPLSIA